MNIREFTPSAKLLWKMNAVSRVKPAVNSAVVRVRKPNSTARPPPNSSRMVSGSRNPGTPIASIYC
ncbi:Uncharacterised protein [Enterobacter cloacae]|nr:Uncharacterised protein [Enterobacter cloacae]